MYNIAYGFMYGSYDIWLSEILQQNINDFKCRIDTGIDLSRTTSNNKSYTVLFLYSYKIYYTIF